jgi:hypothetical protein
MNRTLAATSWIAACAFVVSVAAQTPPPPTEPQQPPQPKEAAEKTVTLTGCLAAGDQPNTFKLTDIGADKKAAQPGEMVGTTGIKTGQAVQLIGTDAAKLKGHIGHTVAVTGMLVPRKEGDPPATPEPARPGVQETADMRLNVTTFKHVDATCPPAGT